MEDLNKIQEFFSKPLEENTFKVGQKVTYLGHPAVVIATKEYNGKNYVSVSYDKGKGKTKASDILTTDGSIKPLKEMMSLDDQAKAYYLEKFKKGEISSLPEDPKAAFLAQMTKDEMEKDAAQYRRETGLEENQTESKFKKGDKITYYGNKGVVNSAKYNPFAKDWDYTISYIEDGTRKGESGVRDKELKSSPINEAKFTDYSNNELAAYAKELSKQRADAASKGQSDLVSGINKEIEAAARELKKRSQKLKDLSRTELNEANVPSNIAEFAKRKGVSSLVKIVAGWAEKVGKRIVGGTAIGKNYDTLILDMTYQGSEIRINTEYETIELYDEPVRTFAQFKRVYEENQEENLDEAITDLRIDNPKFGPAPKQFTSLRAKLGDESLLDKIQMINVNTLRELLDELDSYNLEEGNYNPDQEQLDDEDEIFMPVDDEGRPLGEVEIGDKVKINKEYGGGKGKVTDKIGSFIVVNGKSYHESDVEESGMNEEEGYSKFLKDDPEFPGGKTKGLTPDVMNKILMRVVQDIEESRPGLWDNIRAKQERGEKPSRKGSKAYKTAVKAGKEINKAKN